MTRPTEEKAQVRIAAGTVHLAGDLVLPQEPRGLVLFAHGSGSGRRSTRNRAVAETIRGAGIGTLLFDLLTPAEEEAERWTRHLRFDIELLATRLGAATAWALKQRETGSLPIGYFGASTGAAAALVAAALAPGPVRAVVSRGGRPDLAGPSLARVQAPTLLIVGGDDQPVLDMNREALLALRCEKRLDVVPGATHLFEEPGALEDVARLATAWFEDHLGGGRPASR